MLAAVLLNREALDRVLEILKPEHFYSDANGKIYEAAIALAQLGTPIDITTIASWLRDREKLAQIGGPLYLVQIADATPAVAHVAAHAAVVHEKWRVRQIIAVCQHVAAEGSGDVGVVQEFIDGAEQAIYELARDKTKVEPMQSVAEIARDVFKTITENAERGALIIGTPTGYARLDDKTAGLHLGDLNIVAARPGMGKTSFVMNLAVNIASPRVAVVRTDDDDTEVTTMGDGVVVFSLEMPRKQIVERMICSEGRVDLGRLKKMCLTPDDWRKLSESASYISSLPIWVDDTSTITLLEIRAKVRRRQAEFDREASPGKLAQKVGLVVVDYLQLVKGREGAQSREQEISEISRGLKALAKELKVTVVALSQLNRSTETRGKDKRPQLSDLRESGAIEQDADMIVFIYRDEYYNPETTNRKGMAEFIIAKQRSGPTGTVYLGFQANCTRFSDLAPADYPSDDE